MLIIPKAEIL